MSTVAVDPDTQDALVQKLEDGVLWDSMTGEAPVDVETEVRDGYTVTTEHFADGSVTETGQEIGQEATQAELAAMVAAAAPFLDDGYTGDYTVTPLTSRASGITSCKFGYSAGVRYASNCHIYYHGVTASNSFKANYQQWSGGSKAQYINGTAQFVSVTMTVSNEAVNTYDNGTRIRYSFTTGLAGWGSIPGYLQLKVTPTGTAVTYG
ncbi:MULTISPECIES: hypothetical protein [unclassified Microbacterium]|uniref:hypothetical protein n=1 Tax=unclassified Microbacterium TaxID=2609290 RepID=UPI00109BA5D7|nr:MULTISPECIES: hypothetical protein [unclassified Microbacterium]